MLAFTFALEVEQFWRFPIDDLTTKIWQSRVRRNENQCLADSTAFISFKTGRNAKDGLEVLDRHTALMALKTGDGLKDVILIHHPPITGYAQEMTGRSGSW